MDLHGRKPDSKRPLKDKPSSSQHQHQHQHQHQDLNLSDDDNFDLDEDKPRPTWGAKRGAPGPAAGSGGAAHPSCQADRCAALLTDAKKYHRRHKVCEFHAKAQAVLIAGLRQRFCQQCSRFHELPEFDEAKRSCRRRLAGHNERRRKGSASSEGPGEGSGGRKQVSPPGEQMVKEGQCRVATDERVRVMGHPITGNSASASAAAAAYKHFQIR